MPPQRWRLTLRREATSDVAQRDIQPAWDATLRDAGLMPWPPEWLAPAVPAAPAPAPLGPRLTQPKVVMAAPLPLRMSADRELVDLYLPQTVRAHEARRRLGPALPPGHGLVDLYDVWMGAPALPGMVVAADYRVVVGRAGDGGTPSADASTSVTGESARIAAAIEEILASERVPRGRTSEGRAAVNLRPLILSICVIERRDGGSLGDGARSDGTELWMRLRLDSSVGSGRPDDVVEAIAARTGQPLDIARQHRERLWLRDDAGCPVQAIPPQPSTVPPPQGQRRDSRRPNTRRPGAPSR